MENWPEFIQRHFSTLPFFQFMEATVAHTARGQATIKMPMKPEYSNSYGIVHGGVVAALVDMAAGVALRTLKVRVVTIEVSTNYFEPVALDEELTAEARLVQAGRKILHADVQVFTREGKLAARGKTIYYVRGEDSEECYTPTPSGGAG